jgi:L-alanine-DL-glutamate epimerase-like enolase superfamily enzyme
VARQALDDLLRRRVRQAAEHGVDGAKVDVADLDELADVGRRHEVREHVGKVL